MGESSDADARQALLDRRGHLTRNIFAGCKLGFGASAVADYLLSSVKNAYSVQSGVKDVKSVVEGGARAATGPLEKFVNEVFDVGDLKSVMGELALPQGIGQSIDHFLGVIPGVACIQGGLQALWHLGKAAGHAWAREKVESREKAFRCGDPRVALNAVAEVIGRARNKSGSKAAINATHAAASAGGFFIDGGLASGPALGALKAFATFTYRMYLLARDIRERSGANKLLADPMSIDSKVFAVAPILGCYIMTEASAFDILNFLVGEMGQAGWMDKVEQLIPDMVVVQDLSAQYVRDSSLQLSGLKTDMWAYRGMTRMERMKRWAKRKVGLKR